MARRKNPEAIAWIVGGAVVLGLGYLAYQVVQNQNQLAANNNAANAGTSAGTDNTGSDIQGAGAAAGSVISALTGNQGGGSGS